MSGLVKAKKYNIEDSNIALLGSDLEKNVRLNAAKTEEAWQGVGQELGIRVWRIEKFKVIAWPEDLYGMFYSGDSYIVLRTYKPDPDSDKLAYDVHFWLGKETTQDEAGTAAYKTVELDDFLGGVPVQHREVMGHESALFMTYFSTFRVEEGGIESGFRKVKPEEYRSRLLQVKGSGRRVIVREVAMERDSLNSGDVFILDAGMNIYQFNGNGASGFEKSKAAEFCRALDDERKGLPEVHVFNEDDKDADPFWNAVGGKGPIKSAADGGNDRDVSTAFVKKLIRLSDASGKMEFKEEASGKISLSQFDTNDVFVFDSGAEVFVWIGKGATAEEKRQGLQYAQDYLVKFNRPPYLPISRILEGGENEVFVSSLDSESGKKLGQAAAGAKEGGIPAPAAQ